MKINDLLSQFSHQKDDEGIECFPSFRHKWDYNIGDTHKRHALKIWRNVRYLNGYRIVMVWNYNYNTFNYHLEDVHSSVFALKKTNCYYHKVDPWINLFSFKFFRLVQCLKIEVIVFWGCYKPLSTIVDLPFCKFILFQKRFFEYFLVWMNVAI